VPCGVERDQFVDRAQATDAKTYRVEYLRGLGEAHGYKLVDADARKYFDDRSE
jgi:hypothetical protein